MVPYQSFLCCLALYALASAEVNKATEYLRSAMSSQSNFKSGCSWYCLEDIGNGQSRNANFYAGTPSGWRQDASCMCDDALWEYNRCNLEESAFLDTLYKRHNELRAVHGAPSLSRDAGAESMAKDWAQSLADYYNQNGKLKRGQGIHGGNGPWSQNIASTGGRYTGAGPADSWYSERADYESMVGYGKDPSSWAQQWDNFRQWGHFAVMVNKDFTKIGCGRGYYYKNEVSRDMRKGTIVVCHYGDASGSTYKDNVLRPSGTAPEAQPDSPSNLECEAGVTSSGGGGGGYPSSGGGGGGELCSSDDQCYDSGMNRQDNVCYCKPFGCVCGFKNGK